MTSHTQRDAWRKPHEAFIGLNVDESPIPNRPDDEGVRPGDLYRDMRGRIIAVLGVGQNACPAAIFNADGEFMTVDRISRWQLEKKIRIGRLKEMPRWEAVWGSDVT